MMTFQRLLLSLIVLIVTISIISSEMTFDCRRKGQDCQQGGVCEVDKCNCDAIDPPREGFDCSILTGDKNPNSTACGCENNGVCMNDGTCICNEAHYGEQCKYKRDVILCFGDRKIIYVNPVGFTDGRAFITRNTAECQFKKVKDIEEALRKDFATEWSTDGADGYVITVSDVNENCGNITETSSADGTTITYERSVNIEFQNGIITTLDEILKARCEMNNNTLRAIPGILIKANLTEGQYKPAEIVNNYEPLVFSAKVGDNEIGENPILVGSDITFTFFIPPETDFESVIIDSLEANNTQDAASTISLITDRCTDADASSIVVSVERAEDKRTVTAIIKLFKFVDSDDIIFKGNARICKTGDAACDERMDCSPVTKIKGLGRRKRDSGNNMQIIEKISVTTDPNAASTSTRQTGSSENNQETCPDSSNSDTEEVHCLQRTEIIIVLALLSSTIVILLIACMVLTWRLLRTSPKVAELAPSEYESSRSLPRLSPSNF